MPRSTARLRLKLPKPFELRLALFGHGFVDLAPHCWDAERGVLATVLVLGGTTPADVTLRQSGDELVVTLGTARPLAAHRRGEARAALARMLRLDDDFAELWALCRSEPRLHWVARRGAGRMLRSATLFEDLMKLLFTTNCSWSATRGMTARLVEALGRPAPSGARAFPTPAACAETGERFWRDVVHAGYRAAFACALSRNFADGTLDEAHFAGRGLGCDAVRERLLEIRGFGPYAAGQALRLLGHYPDLALDSWCRARLAQLRNRRRPPSDRSVEREYRRFGTWRGLVLWMDLTAAWHGEHPSTGLTTSPDTRPLASA